MKDILKKRKANRDCLEKGLEYYHHKLGLQIDWKTDNAIGLLMNDCKIEIVIQNKDNREEADIKRYGLQTVREI